ncbi:hypothetical protein WJX77_012621 [Trebouxia sp. C0004]
MLPLGLTNWNVHTPLKQQFGLQDDIVYRDPRSSRQSGKCWHSRPSLPPLTTGNKTARDTPDKWKTKQEDKEMISIPLLEEQGYFDVPIQVAAMRLGLGVTTLKRICRDNNISRWPYRKRKSLGTLIDRTKQVLDDGTGQDNLPKLAALQVLEKQRQIMQSFQNQDMDDKIKSYRQALFKLDRGRNNPEASANPF